MHFFRQENIQTITKQVETCIPLGTIVRNLRTALCADLGTSRSRLILQISEPKNLKLADLTECEDCRTGQEACFLQFGIASSSACNMFLSFKCIPEATHPRS